MPIFMLLIVLREQWDVKVWVCVKEALRGGREERQMLRGRGRMSTGIFNFG